MGTLFSQPLNGRMRLTLRTWGSDQWALLASHVPGGLCPALVLHLATAHLPCPAPKCLLTPHVATRTTLVKVIASLSAAAPHSWPTFSSGTNHRQEYSVFIYYASCLPSWLEHKLHRYLDRNGEREGTQQPRAGGQVMAETLAAAMPQGCWGPRQRSVRACCVSAAWAAVGGSCRAT